MWSLKRTHHCGELRISQVGETACLNGFVKTRRDHGGLIFIDLRDRYGQTQVVFNPQKVAQVHKLAETLKPESTITVKGKVVARPAGMVNPKIPTGEIELSAEALEIISTSETPPFEIEDNTAASLELRFKYRYLDLRSKSMQNNLIARHKIIRVIRDYFDRQGFVEIETPFLTKSTPEGARDYLVPSRILPGHFFALPQSPQLFKQLLMVAGFDKYFQIVRCFRDEDLRADRQPEFTQIDLEMSFVNEDDVLKVTEDMFTEILRQMFKSSLRRPADEAWRDLKTPFPRITYQEAIELYGTDKPDIRFKMHLTDVTEIMGKGDYQVFNQVIKTKGVIKGLKVTPGKNFSRKEIDKLSELVKEHGATGLTAFKVENRQLVASAAAKFFNPTLQKELIERMKAQAGDWLLLVADKPEITHQILALLRNHLAEKLGLINKDEFAFVWVTDFPLFEYNQEEKRLQSRHHPFTSPQEDDLARLDRHPLDVKARAYDLVLNGIEIGGGSIRIHSPDLQRRIFKLLKLVAREAEEKFGFLLEAFKYGVPPHGGIALGLDRIIMLLLGLSSIREVIAFPKTAKAACLLTNAPAPVSPEQLKELGIKFSPYEATSK